MIKFILLVLIFPLFFSCSKNEGCNVHSAINYDPKVDFDDDSCIYSKLIFFADSTQINGVSIDRIEIEINNVNVGSFSGMYLYGPGDCNADNTVVFASTGEDKVIWSSTIYFVGGGTAFSSGEAFPSPLDECIEIHASI